MSVKGNNRSTTATPSGNNNNHVLLSWGGGRRCLESGKYVSSSNPRKKCCESNQGLIVTTTTTASSIMSLCSWNKGFVVFLTITVFLSTLAFQTCEGFSAIANNNRHTKISTERHVITTTRNSTNRLTPIVGPFPSEDVEMYGAMLTTRTTASSTTASSSSTTTTTTSIPRGIHQDHQKMFSNSNTNNNEREVSKVSENTNTNTNNVNGNHNNNNDKAQEAGNYQQEDSDDEKRSRRLEHTAMASNLLSQQQRQRRNGTPKNNEVLHQKTTSVGSRRIGSASKARERVSSVSRLTDAVRKAAAANTVIQPTNNDNNNPSSTDDNSAASTKQSMKSEFKFSSTTVHNTVQGMMSSVLGSVTTLSPITSQQHPAPNTILLSPEQQSNRWSPSDRVSVRVATESDDADIASLRLSVFSNFSTEMRKAFVSRSCHVLSTRRNRGASCIVATVPRYGTVLSPKQDIILGSAECSFHEFHGTMLGRSRLKGSVLYITEVAVSPTARRKGIGLKLMKALDNLAQTRGAETLYLHVDVNNSVALSLYKKCGYSCVPTGNSIFYDFTKSLNLHDGATKGRNHYLMYKDLKKPTWIMLNEKSSSSSEVQSNRPLGFEIPC